MKENNNPSGDSQCPHVHSPLPPPPLQSYTSCRGTNRIFPQSSIYLSGSLINPFFFLRKNNMGNTKVPNLMTPREVGFPGHPGWVVRCTSRSHSMDCIEFSTVTQPSNFHARRCFTSNDNRCAQRYNNEVHNSQH